MTADRSPSHLLTYHPVPSTTATEDMPDRAGNGTDRAVTDVERAQLLLDVTRASVLELIERAHVHPTSVRLSVAGISLEMDWAPVSCDMAAVAAPDAATALSHAGTVAPSGAQDGATAVSHRGVVTAPTAAVVTAPAVGVFYRAPEPAAAPFAEVGDAVAPGQKVGLIEAMKLMIPVEANCHGTVAEVLGVNGQPVEFGQPLLTITPLAGGK